MLELTSVCHRISSCCGHRVFASASSFLDHHHHHHHHHHPPQPYSICQLLMPQQNINLELVCRIERRTAVGNFHVALLKNFKSLDTFNQSRKKTGGGAFHHVHL
jgi:hypothetical protein